LISPTFVTPASELRLSGGGSTRHRAGSTLRKVRYTFLEMRRRVQERNKSVRYCLWECRFRSGVWVLCCAQRECFSTERRGDAHGTWV